MIATLTQIVPLATDAGSTDRQELTLLSIIVVGLLLTLLIEREIFRCFAGSQPRLAVQTLQIAILPLLLTFAVIVATRVTDLLGS